MAIDIQIRQYIIGVYDINQLNSADNNIAIGWLSKPILLKTTNHHKIIKFSIRPNNADIYISLSINTADEFASIYNDNFSVTIKDKDRYKYIIKERLDIAYNTYKKICSNWQKI